MTGNPPLPTSLGYTASENADGSVIIALDAPVVFGGESCTRLTIPRLTGRHLRNAGWALSSESAKLGELVAFAASIVEPVGVIDELDALTAMNVATEVAVSMGKSRRRGAATSPM